MSHDPRACCTEHGRAARAGAGLPAIEAGMPDPAGTGLSRRSFLLRSAGLALSVYGGAKVLGAPAFEAGVAQAAGGPGDAGRLRVLLAGAIDSLSVLAPIGDAQYRRLRPTLGLEDGAG